jgi:hypothetical protein
MKKQIVFLFTAALAVAVFVLIFKPEPLDRLRGTTVNQRQEESATVGPQSGESPAPPSAVWPGGSLSVDRDGVMVCIE